MPATKQTPLGYGTILWLGVNKQRGAFSIPQESITIKSDGIAGDIYRGMWRPLSAHDGDYIVTDGSAKGDMVLNHRQITIVDRNEVLQAGQLSGATITPGMLRENIYIDYIPNIFGYSFSRLPPFSRMIINHGTERATALYLTEENGPCHTICRPMSRHLGVGPELADALKANLAGKRGQMAMVRSEKPETVRRNDRFVIFPPLT